MKILSSTLSDLESLLPNDSRTESAKSSAVEKVEKILKEGGTFEEVGYFWQAVGEVTRKLGLKEAGYRVLTNSGRDAHQEVMHFHVHIVGGRPLGPMLEGADLPSGSK